MQEQLQQLHLTTFQLDKDSTYHMVTLMLQMTTIQNKMDLNAMAHPLWTCGTQTNQQQDRMELTTRRHSLKKCLLQVLNEHNPSTPLFLYYAPHIVHAPLQVPDNYANKFNFIDNQNRQIYDAMVTYLDEVVGKFSNVKAFGMIYFLWSAVTMVDH